MCTRCFETQRSPGCICTRISKFLKHSLLSGILAKLEAAVSEENWVLTHFSNALILNTMNVKQNQNNREVSYETFFAQNSPG